ncbi:hypothetical protein A2970_02195 [Candidatus Roizmanbacteria bacterium RIFCSPLOWO2_01_FULL_44_13]|uniref:Uncharacterized protein n=1 Tax=Candidatus Roizmanbacteria bacterium RIFCSPLOWO2_01_FULL_44_13 TaxID=1802069 RepID=A0A1F7JB59_9BACT|nr:MAG: hypothetical protein A2970_02195 [Candidatus Roizmanbacteria bacterium RIFCSPLOWO2_01_FULL_44_13]
MPGKLSLEARPANRPRTQDLINAAIVLGAGIGRTPSKELLHSAIPIDEPIPMGHDCTRCAAVASCSLLNLASKNNGDNPITRRIKAIQMLKGIDPEFMQKTNNEQRETMIREKMGALKNESKPLITIKRSVKKLEPTPLTKKSPGLIEVNVKKPEIKPEIKIRPMIVVNIPKPPVEKPAPAEKKEFKKERPVVVKPSEKTPDKITTLPETKTKKIKTIFDRVVYEKISKSEPKPLKLGPLTFVPLPTFHIRHEPSKVTEAHRRIKIEKKISTKQKEIEHVFRKPATKIRSRVVELKRTIELKPTIRIETKEIKKPETRALVEKIKRVILKEKQAPLLVIVLPISNEKPVKKQRLEQKDEQKQEPEKEKERIDHEVIPLQEKTFVNFINLAVKITKAVESLSVKENKKLVVKLITLYDEGVSPSPEEIQIGPNTQTNNAQIIIWYITKVLSSINLLSFYLITP